MIIRTIIIALLAGFTWNAAIAGEAVLSWSEPTGTEQCTNGGPLTNLAGYRVYRMIAEFDAPAESWTDTGLEAGEYTYAMTAVTETGAESRLSGPVSKTVEVGLTVADERAYVVAKINDGFLTVPAGTVPLGTQCEPGDTVNGLHVVPTDAVTWTATVRDVLVMARCE